MLLAFETSNIKSESFLSLDKISSSHVKIKIAERLVSEYFSRILGSEVSIYKEIQEASLSGNFNILKELNRLKKEGKKTLIVKQPETFSTTAYFSKFFEIKLLQYTNQSKLLRSQDFIKYELENVNYVFAYVRDMNLKGLIIRWVEYLHTQAAEATPTDAKLSKSKSVIDINKIQSEMYIKADLIQRLNDIENNISAEIESFKLLKIRCAAWTELLKDYHYFKAQFLKYSIKNLNHFSRYRYGVDIYITLQKSQQLSREKHKNELKKYLL